jgi:hypothetical protein
MTLKRIKAFDRMIILTIRLFSKRIAYCASEYKGSVTDQMNPGDLSISINGLLQE